MLALHQSSARGSARTLTQTQQVLTCMAGQSMSPSQAPQVRTSQEAASHLAVAHSTEASMLMKPAWNVSVLASNTSSWRTYCANRSSYAAVLGTGVAVCRSKPVSAELLES